MQSFCPSIMSLLQLWSKNSVCQQCCHTMGCKRWHVVILCHVPLKMRRMHWTAYLLIYNKKWNIMGNIFPILIGLNDICCWNAYPRKIFFFKNTKFLLLFHSLSILWISKSVEHVEFSTEFLFIVRMKETLNFVQLF